MSPVVIRLAGKGAHWRGPYLADYDLESYDGRGSASFTNNRDQALVFPDMAVAFDAWRSQSVTVPLRPDGKPNRPLTAYTVAFEQVS